MSTPTIHAANSPASASSSSSKPKKSEADVERATQIVMTILSYTSPLLHKEVIEFFLKPWNLRLSTDSFWIHLFKKTFGLTTQECSPNFYYRFAKEPALNTWACRTQRAINLRKSPKAVIPLTAPPHHPLTVWTESEFRLIGTKECVYKFDARAADSFSISPDGKWAASGSRSGELFVLNLSNGKKEEIEESRLPSTVLTTLEHIQFAFDGTLLAAYAADQEGFVCRWDPKTLRCTQKFKTPGYHTESFTLSSSGRRAFIQITETIPLEAQTKQGNVFTTSLYEYDFETETNKKIPLPGPSYGMIWKEGLAVLGESTLIAAIRQGDKPTQLWAIYLDTGKSALLPIPGKGEITQLQAGINDLLYAITDTNQLFVYDVINRKIIWSYSDEKAQFKGLRLQSNASTVVVTRLQDGQATVFVFPNVQTNFSATASASTATAATPTVGSKRKRD